MTKSSPFAKFVALTLALLVHGGLVSALVSRETAMIEGSDGASEVRLGNDFADMAAGTLNAEQSDLTEAEPIRPDQVTPETTEEQTPQAEPDRAIAETAEPAQRSETLETAQREPSTQSQPQRVTETMAALRPETTDPLPTPQAAAPVTSDGILSPSLAEPLRPEPVEQSETVQPSEPVAQHSETTPEVLEASEPQSAAVARSARPKPRSAEFVETHKPAPAAKPAPQRTAQQPKRPAPQAQGNSNRNARAGEATGNRQATARQSGSGGQQQAAGNAAVSNYPGLVMRKLSRAGKPRVNARGTAVIAFTIAASGGVASVSLARSSGSSALDQAAVRLVRGAGPFPKPPQGARRSFSVQIKGR